jgi:hypothetical protein
MKCFNHRELDAIAVCKHSGRALCSGCTGESSGMAACKGRCEAAVDASHAETQLNLQGFRSTMGMFRVMAPLSFTIGLIAVIVGTYALIKEIGGREEPTTFVLVGVGLIAAGYVFRHLAREFKLRAEKLP